MAYALAGRLPQMMRRDRKWLASASAALRGCSGSLRYGDGWADVIDTLTMYPDVRRQVARSLAEIEAAGR